MLLITGSAHPAEGARSRLIATALDMAEATRGDAGCIHYAFTASLEDDAIVSTEIWEDRAALDAHMKHDHTRQFLEGLDGAIAGDPVMNETQL
jgi:quinol monooxygenase YgiN